MDKLYGTDTKYFIGVVMSVVILGGGTAGWLTALMVRAYYPRFEIKVVESEEIGILGAGEGTTPHFIEALQHLDIHFSELVKECKATVKHGINFVNWNGDGKSYSHDFNVQTPLDEFQTKLIFKKIYEGKRVDELSFSRKLIQNNLVGFSYKNSPMVLLEEPFKNLNSHTFWATHFDARALAKFFRKKAEERGIERIEGKLKSVVSDENGYINKIILENDVHVDVAFIFDCSGFARLLIGKHFNTEWVSYANHLPLKKAVPFFIEHDGNIGAKTDAIAMKYGWIWKIPVDGRYGCGYVFDSDYIDEEKALKEAEEYFGRKLESPKTFSFNAGTFKETLVKNCMAVGLAQSFVEPLEATSIWISYSNLGNFLSANGLFTYRGNFSKSFNDVCFTKNEQVKEFLYLHYLTKRNDSEFWKEFREKNPMIESVREKIDLTSQFLNTSPTTACFESRSWTQVCDGLGLINKDFSESTRALYDFNHLEIFEKSFLQNQQNVLKTCLTHKEFLEHLKTF